MYRQSQASNPFSCERVPHPQSLYAKKSPLQLWGPFSTQTALKREPPRFAQWLKKATGCFHTPAVGKSLLEAHTGCSHTPEVGKSLLVVHTGCSHTPTVGKSLLKAHPGYSHTPAMGTTLQDQAIYIPADL